MSSDFGNLLTNWYIIEDKASPNDQESDENTSSMYYNHIVYCIY